MKKPIFKNQYKNQYLNLFDLLVISGVILGLVFVAFFLLRRSKKIEVIVKITDKNILYSYNNPPTWFTEYFKEGMSAKDGLGRKTAEIKRVYRYDTSDNEKAVYLTLDIKADFSRGTGKYSFEGQSILIGAPIKIEFQNILVEGLVSHVEGIADERKSKEIVVESQNMWISEVFPETYGAPSFVADNLKIGDEVKDSLGNILITVIDKKVEPAKKIITNASGRIFVSNDPLKQDLYLTLKLNIKEINEEYYIFDNVRIKVGSCVPIHLKNISLCPTVTKILEAR